MRLAAFLVAVLFTLSSCDSASNNGYSVNLVNEDSQPIHVLTPGDSFSPDNRLSASGESGDSRFVNFPDGMVDDIVVFRAGQNGTVFTQTSCALRSASPRNANVYYRSSGILECEGW